MRRKECNGPVGALGMGVVAPGVTEELPDRLGDRLDSPTPGTVPDPEEHDAR